MPIEEKGSAEELARLRRERDEADRLYNEALTNLDAAIHAPRELPPPPRPYDEFQITPLNERWELLSLKPGEHGDCETFTDAARSFAVRAWGSSARRGDLTAAASALRPMRV